MPKCRICHQIIDKKNTDWCMPSVNYYYHIKCYQDWKNNQSKEDEEWIDMIYDFLSRDLKVSYNHFLCESQRKKFLRENKFTNKGIYFALKYFYEVKGNSWDKGHGGIGIVEYVYAESREYWIEQERRRKGFMAALEKELEIRNKEPEKIIRRPPPKKKKKVEYDWNNLGGEDNG